MTNVRDDENHEISYMALLTHKKSTFFTKINLMYLTKVWEIVKVKSKKIHIVPVSLIFFLVEKILKKNLQEF